MSEQLEFRPVSIDWEGPFLFAEACKKFGEHDAGLYQIYGHHPVFGFDALYYVGMTEWDRFGSRLASHWEEWGQWLSDATVRLGYLNDAYYRHDDDWKEWAELLKHAEALTIYLHSPPGNSESIGAYTGPPLVVYNWRQRGSLLMQYASHWQTGYPNGEWKRL